MFNGCTDTPDRIRVFRIRICLRKIEQEVLGQQIAESVCLCEIEEPETYEQKIEPIIYKPHKNHTNIPELVSAMRILTIWIDDVECDDQKFLLRKWYWTLKDLLCSNAEVKHYAASNGKT